MSDAASSVDPTRRRFRFSIRGMLIVIAFVAAFLGGRSSMRTNPGQPPPQPGPWTVHVSPIYSLLHPIRLVHLGDDRFELQGSPGYEIGGEYVWKRDRLVAVRPHDWRYKGLTWMWSGDMLVVVHSPLLTVGSESYAEAVMWPGDGPRGSASP